MITPRPFGQLDGNPVMQGVLETPDARVSVMNYGCVIRDWRVTGRDHAVVLGFDQFDDYPRHSASFGVIAGRVANRIANARFHLDGKEYNVPANFLGKHCLHGGAIGLQRRLWTMEADTAARALRLSYRSPDGEEGFPGAVDFTVTMQLDGAVLTIDMEGRPDRPTPINLAQHNYYNLNGMGDVRGHWLHVAAEQHTAVDEELIPTGEIAPVEGTPMDFRAPARIGDVDPKRVGFDSNLVLNPDRDVAAPAATAWSDESGLQLSLWTEEPGLQLYDSANMDIPVAGLDGTHYGPFAGLCLEAQHFPDAVNHPSFPSIVCTPERPYHQRLAVEIRQR